MVETLLGIQIIAALFAVFMLYVAFVHYKQHNIEKFEFIFWLGIWSSFLYFALFPRVLDPILAKLFVARAMDLIFIVGFMILAYLGFSNHVGIKSLQKHIETLTRKKALDGNKK